MSRWFAAFAVLPLFSLPALADDLGDALKPWNLELSNTARYDHYATGGNSATSPFQTSGSEWYDEVDGSASRQFSQYRQLHTDFTALVNEDAYRSSDKNLTVERANVTYENGETSVPYRLEAGDYFANLSYRTEQQSLKGMQVEFQPTSKLLGDQSLLFFTGDNNPSWQNIGKSIDSASGGSWLVQNDLIGRGGVNFVYNYRNGIPTTNAATLPLNRAQQFVESAVDNKDFDLGTERLNFDGEAAHFYGDYNNGVTTIRNRGDEGVYVDLTGHSTALKPLGYGVRYEDYGNNFRPAQALILSDHRGIENQVSWRFDQGINLRARADFYSEGLYSKVDEQDTSLYGLSAQGPLLAGLAPDVTGHADYYHQITADKLKTVHLDVDSFSSEFSKPIAPGWAANGRFALMIQNDVTSADNDYHLYQWAAGVTRSFELAGWSGSVHPGAVVRHHVGNVNRGFDAVPAFDLHMSRDNQSLDFGYNVLFQGRNQPISGYYTPTPYDKTQNISLDYAYHVGGHDFGVSGTFYDHNTTPASAYTNATRVGIYWTYHIAKPAGQTDFASGALGLAEGGLNASGEADVSLLAVLAPGSSKADALREIAAAEINGPIATPTSVVYEANLLPTIDLRQRLVLGIKGNAVERSSLILDAQDPSNVTQLQDDYGRIRNALLKSLGRPAKEYDPNSSIIASADNSNTILQRFVEWRTRAGTLRFGLSRGTDGVARFELQHAASFANASSTFWGVKF